LLYSDVNGFNHQLTDKLLLKRCSCFCYWGAIAKRTKFVLDLHPEYDVALCYNCMKFILKLQNILVSSKQYAEEKNKKISKHMKRLIPNEIPTI